MISIIAAMSLNRVIGKDNWLPWDLPLELKHLRDTTYGHHFIIGRKTFEAIGSKPLPNRIVIVVSNSLDPIAEKCLIVRNLKEALKGATESGDSEIFIAGGTQLFEEGLLLADRIYLTTVNATLEGDTFFPEFDETLWKVVEESIHFPDEVHVYGWKIQVLDRRR